MTDIPADAQRSDDGQWWWDGSQWQTVASQVAGGATTATAEQQGGTAAAAPAAQPETAAASPARAPAAGAPGQLSEDGQWRWDGSQWQPAQAGAGGAASAAASTSSTAAPGGPQVTLGLPTAEAHAVHDGTMEAVISYSITNSGTTPIEAGAIELGFFIVAQGQSAESAAYLVGDMPVALAPGQVHNGHGRMQADPGSWILWVGVSDPATGESLASSDIVLLEVAGHQAHSQAFDNMQAYALAVTITNVEHVADSMYRVHYDVESNRDVPAGMRVVGRVEGSEWSTAQVYDFTAPITAGRHNPHYLTLGADAPSHSTAHLMLDPGGASETSESVVFDVAEDGTPTITR